MGRAVGRGPEGLTRRCVEHIFPILTPLAIDPGRHVRQRLVAELELTSDEVYEVRESRRDYTSLYGAAAMWRPRSA